MKKILAVIILLAILSFYRDSIIDYSAQFLEEDQDSFAWVGSQRASLEEKLPRMDFNSSVTALQDFENEIQKSIQNLNQNDDKSLYNSRRRQLICELAVVYKKTAMQYLANGDAEMYTAYIQKSQNQLIECADLNNAPDSGTGD